MPEATAAVAAIVGEDPPDCDCGAGAAIEVAIAPTPAPVESGAESGSLLFPKVAVESVDIFTADNL